MNIRVAREKRGCAKDIIPYLIHRNSIYNTLFVSPPGIGKTTYLRDAIRILSNGSDRLHGMKISIIDERSEIAACRQGIPQNDVGIRTDVLDCCSKAEGMVMLLRSMAPQVIAVDEIRSDVLDGCLKSFGMLLMLRSMAPQIIAVDEIGSREDCRAMEQAIYSGSRIIGTVHAYDMKELSRKKYLKEMLEQQMFGRIVLLEKAENGRRRFHIYDENLEKIC